MVAKLKQKELMLQFDVIFVVASQLGVQKNCDASNKYMIRSDHTSQGSKEEIEKKIANKIGKNIVGDV